jgi:hypothetical protein
LHYVNQRKGVKEFDVWSFYARYDDWPFPAPVAWNARSRPSKFGRYPDDGS